MNITQKNDQQIQKPIEKGEQEGKENHKEK
jgi:hypothetical protein